MYAIIKFGILNGTDGNDDMDKQVMIFTVDYEELKGFVASMAKLYSKISGIDYDLSFRGLASNIYRAHRDKHNLVAVIAMAPVEGDVSEFGENMKDLVTPLGLVAFAYASDCELDAWWTPQVKDYLPAPYEQWFENSMELVELMVDPEYQRQGYGSKLFKIIVDEYMDKKRAAIAARTGAVEQSAACGADGATEHSAACGADGAVEQSSVCEVVGKTERSVTSAAAGATCKGDEGVTVSKLPQVAAKDGEARQTAAANNNVAEARRTRDLKYGNIYEFEKRPDNGDIPKEYDKMLIFTQMQGNDAAFAFYTKMGGEIIAEDIRFAKLPDEPFYILRKHL